MSKKGKYEKVVPKKRLAWWKILLIVLGVVALLATAAVGLGWNYFKGLVGDIRQATSEENELSDEELYEILGYIPEDDTTPTQTEDPIEAAEATEPSEEETTGEEDTKPSTTAKPADTSSDYGQMGKIINIMLIGQSYRPGEETKLADTMILCTLNRETDTLTMTSFMRDMYIQLPNYKGKICGQQRINVCYNLGWRWGGDLGGMEMLSLLIKNNFGVEVDYNVEINFDAVIKVVDLMGGVPVVLTEDEAKFMTEFDQCEGSFTAGENLLAGDAALVYARTRSSNASDNDFNRTARQRYLITQIIKKCMSMNLKELNKLLKEVMPMILTDMTEEEILELSKIALSMLSNLKIESNQCPAEGTYQGAVVQIYGQDAGVLIPNVQANKELLMALCEADVLEAEENS